MRRAAAAAIVALGASACGPDAPGVDATVQAVLSAPSGVQCIRIVASSATRTEVRQFAVAQGQASQPLALQGLPTGNVLFAGAAYGVPCEAIAEAQPTWVADPTVQVLQPGVPATLTLTFHLRGSETDAADYLGSQYSVATLAGSGAAGNADGIGTEAQLTSPSAIALGPQTAYVADTGNHAVRTLDPATGAVGTLAVGVELPDLRGLALFGVDLFATDGCAIRRIDLPHATQSVLVGDPACGDGSPFGSLRGIVAIGATLYVADAGQHVIRRVVLDPAGPKASILAGQGTAGAADGVAGFALFNAPDGLAAAPNGQLIYVADRGNCTVRRVSLVDGSVDTLPGLAGACAVVDEAGDLARFSAPAGVAADDSSIFVADAAGQTVRRIDLASSAVMTIAGSGAAGHFDGVGAAARFAFPALLTLDATGKLYLADSGNHAIRTLTRLAPPLGEP